MAGGGETGLDRAGGVADDLKFVCCGDVLLGDLGRAPGGDDGGGAGEHFEELVAGVVAARFIPEYGAEALQDGDGLRGEDVLGEAGRGQV
ncbi:MAG: hypothetical protein OXF62_13945 [Caldilineaceae bacterium]|nr:hypothetical protein [Caldilineaceae bacterium]